tara:strand:- start:1513 stop:1899 length:387 start_codon:yes stop_codon:yes gene_type:complete
MLDVLKYMAITAAGMAIIEAHAADTPFSTTKDYVDFNVSITKTVLHTPECARASLAVMSTMPAEWSGLSSIASNYDSIGDLPVLASEIAEIRDLSVHLENPDILTARCAFLMGQAYGSAAGYFFFSEM